MKNYLLIPLLSIALLAGCSSNKSSTEKSSTSSNMHDEEKIVLPDVFKNTNFCNAAVTYYSGGVALVFDNNNNPDIQNISFELDFLSIEFEQFPLKKKDSMYFLPFKVTNQVIDDGYLKNDVEYKFWLSYEDSTYYCGISLNDDTLTEPDAILMEGLM